MAQRIAATVVQRCEVGSERAIRMFYFERYLAARLLSICTVGYYQAG
jgi:hypothetical protein